MIAVLCTLSLALAADATSGSTTSTTSAPAPPAPSRWSELVEYRVITSVPSDWTVDSEGTTVGQSLVADQRLRVGADYAGSGWHAGTEWDLLDGQMLGDTWDIPGVEDERRRDALTSLSLAGIRPRRASVGLDLPKVRLDLGLTTSQWGLGLVANDGSSDPLFGRSDFGDRVIRLRAATRPIPTLTVVAAADVVAADDTADLLDAQLATQGVVAAVYRPVETVQTGLYGVYRHQLDNAFDADGDHATTNAGVLDVYGRVTTPIGGWMLDAGAEAAGITGSTTRARSYASIDGLALRSAGAIARARADEPSRHVGIVLAGGYLTGDADSGDGVSNAFTADRDFDAGMVLFDEVQGAIDAATFAQVTDPAYSDHPTDGADSLVSEGAIRGATWAQPAVVVTPVSWLEVRAGGLFAWSTAPVSQPFQTFRAGGVPTNMLGEATNGYRLGSELDWAVIVGGRDALAPTPMVKWPKVRPALLVQGGHAWLSSNLGGGRVDLVTVSGRIRI
jgi:hypothetical protein